MYLQRLTERLLRYDIVSLAIILLSISTILYWDFIFGDKFYVYPYDIGSDTYRQYLPFTVLASNQFDQFSFFSFQIGMGDTFFKLTQLFDPFNLPLYFLQDGNVKYGLVYIMISKHIAAGIGFYLYTSFFGFSVKSRMLLAVYFAYSGFMVVWGQHYAFATTFVFAIMTLWMFERWLHKQRYVGLLISLVLFSVFSLYFFFEFLIGFMFYAVLRYIYVNQKFMLKDFLTFFAQSSFIGFVAFSIAAVVILPMTYIYITSPRIDAEQLFSWTHIITFVPGIVEESIAFMLRIYSNDLLGTGDEFLGPRNYYASALLYSGLLSLLLLPYIFKDADKKQKIIFSTVGILVSLFLTNSFFNSMVTGFNKEIEYRITYYVTIILLLSLGRVLSNEDLSFRKSILNIAFTHYATIVILAVLFISNGVEFTSFITPALIITLIMMLTYTIYFYLNYDKTRGFLILMLIVILEAVVMNYQAVNHRKMLSTTDVAEMKGYADNTKKAIEWIKKNDDEKFFRIEKTYNSFYLNDAVYQGYYGLEGYGLSHSSSIEFYSAMDIQKEGETAQSTNYMRWNKFLTNLANVLSVKYYLSKRPIASKSLELIKRLEDIYIYKSNNYMPFGIIYDNYLTVDDFTKLSLDQKRYILKDTGVVHNLRVWENKAIERGSVHSEVDLLDWVKIDQMSYKVRKAKILEDKLPQKLIFQSSSADSRIISKFPEQNVKDMKISFELDSKKSLDGKILWKNSIGDFTMLNSKPFEISEGKHRYETVLKLNEYVNSIWIHIENDPNSVFEMQNLTVHCRETNVVENIEKSSPLFNITRFDGDRIHGNIELENPKLLFFSIPFDKGWTAVVNGEEKELRKVNIGFMGFVLDEGKYDITLIYRPVWFDIGLLITISSFIIVICFFLMKTIGVRMRAN